MKKYFSVLRACPLFNHISDENLIGLLGCLGARVVKYSKNQIIIEEGGPARYIGIVLSGSAQIVQVDYFGNRSIISSAGVSELFGESFACADINEIPISAVADEACEIMFIDCVNVLKSCSNSCEFHRQLIYNLMKDIATKNIKFHRKIRITSKRSTRDKLMEYLLITAKENNSSSFDIPFDRQALADFLEVDRSGLSAEIGKMRKEGIIASRKNHFELL